MSLFAVIAQALAVIADDGNERRLEESELVQAIHDRCEHRIGERDLAVVRAVAKQLAEGGRRPRRRMWIVEMQPDEERVNGCRLTAARAVGAGPRILPGVLLEPRRRLQRGEIAAPLDLEVHDLLSTGLEPIVV